MGCQAEIHALKSEYIDSCHIYTLLLETASLKEAPYAHGLARLNLASVQIASGMSNKTAQENIDVARSIFKSLEAPRPLKWLDAAQANLKLLEGDILGAETIFQQCLEWRGKDSELFVTCLQSLGDGSYWNSSQWTSTWATVLLAHSLRSKLRLGLNKALQFLGDIFLTQGEENTAISLFTVALEGFTFMDVHRSRAECMLHLANIHHEKKEFSTAKRLWKEAIPLFEKSLQAKNVHDINAKLHAIRHDDL
jgi:tetratricopeptide (TPR) repeat protein